MSEATSSPVQFGASDDGEELARAEVYGLLASLFKAAPTAELYAQLGVAVTEAPSAGGFLEGSWTELVGAAQRLTLADVTQEYAALFGGVGKPDIALNGSWFLAGALNEKPLVALRDELAALGLERAPEVAETEDHFSALCEVMRYLIAGDDLAVSNLVRQQRFFNVQLRSWGDALCDQIAQHPQADFYRALAVFTKDFLAVEAQGFDLI
ncbi:MAG TPA: molecular chaperone TorD family protein [Burkholderiaceae bacterium]